MSRNHLSRQDMISYLGNSLSAEQSHEIEKHLLSCPFCTEAIEGLAQTSSLPRLEQNLRNSDLRMAAAVSVPPVSSVRPINRWLWPAAAGIALFLTAGLLIYNNRNLEPEQLFAAHFKGYKDYTSSTFRSTAAQNQTLLVNAMLPYREENYHLAVATLTDYLKTDPGNIPATFYLGIAKLHERQFESALTCFQNAQDPNLPTYAEPALWHEALCQLRLGNKEKAKALFSKVIENNNGVYTSEAKEILDNL
jgi:tetratricopeptide (TPR) repeat protein